MSSTINKKTCCCPEQSCGYCSHSKIEVEEDDSPRRGEVPYEGKYLYCLDKPRENIVDGYDEEPIDNVLYGQSCPDTELMQICINDFTIKQVDQCGWKWSPPNTEDVNLCQHEYQHCWSTSDTPTLVHFLDTSINVVIYRDEENPCVWTNIKPNGERVITDIKHGIHFEANEKTCFKTDCCHFDGSWKYDDVRTSGIVMMGFQIYDVELRLTPWCIEDDNYAQQLGYPIGTCGRLVQVKVRFRFNDEPVDDPTPPPAGCIPHPQNPPYPSYGTCLKYHPWFQGETCNRLYDGGSDYILWDFRGGIKHRGWFFPSCGCMPYCWVDDDCEECGEYFEEGATRSEGCFKKSDTPIASEDVKGRDRLCNAKDCGSQGCCKGNYELNICENSGHEDMPTIGCCKCEDPELRPWLRTGIGEWNCPDHLRFTGFSDTCGRGITYTTEGDSSPIGKLLMESNTYGGDFPEDNACDDTTDFYGCCGHLTTQGNCPDAEDYEFYFSGYNPWTRTAETDISDEGRGAPKGFEMNWRIVPAYET